MPTRSQLPNLLQAIGKPELQIKPSDEVPDLELLHLATWYIDRAYNYGHNVMAAADG